MVLESWVPAYQKQVEDQGGVKGLYEKYKASLKPYEGVLVYPSAPDTSLWSSIENSILMHNTAGASFYKVWQRANLYNYANSPEREDWEQQPFDLDTLKGTPFELYMQDFVGMSIGEASFYQTQLDAVLQREKDYNETGFLQHLVGGGIAMALDPLTYVSFGLAGKVGGFLGNLTKSSRVRNVARESLALGTLEFFQSKTRRQVFANRQADSLAAEVGTAAAIGAVFGYASPWVSKQVAKLWGESNPLHEAEASVKRMRNLNREVEKTLSESSVEQAKKEAAQPDVPPFSRSAAPEDLGKLEDAYLAEAERLQLKTEPTEEELEAFQRLHKQMVDHSPDFQGLKTLQGVSPIPESNDYWGLDTRSFSRVTSALYNATKKFLSNTGMGGPASTLMEADVPAAKSIFLNLQDTVLHTSAEMEGIARPVNARSLKETRYRAFMHSFGEMLKKEYIQFKKNPNNRKLNFTQFKEEVGYYASGSIQDTSDDMFRTAKRYRTYMTLLTTELQKRKILPETMGELPNAKWYFPQVYDRAKLNSNPAVRADLIDTVYQHFLKTWPERKRQELDKKFLESREKIIAKKYEPAKETSALASLAKRKVKALQKLEKEITTPEFKQKIRIDANEAVENATGLNLGFTGPKLGSVSAERSWVKQRQITIPQHLLAPYSETDVYKVVDQFAKSAFSDMTLVDLFGTTELTESNIYKDMQKAYAEMLSKVENDADRLRLTKQREAVNNAVRLLWADARGFHGPASSTGADRMLNRVSSAVSSLASVLYLGAVALSMLPEVTVKMLHVGARPYLRGVYSFVKEYRTTGIALKELEEFGIALRQNMYSTLPDYWSDLGPTHTVMQKAESGLNFLGKVQGTVSGYNFVEQKVRQLGTTIALQGIRKDIPALAEGKLEKTLVARYASLGIGEQEAKAIAQMLKEHGKGIHLNLGQWTDDAARVRTLTAIQSSVNNAIVAGDVTTTPTIFRHGLARLFWLFSNWMFAANHRILLAGLQKGVVESVLPMLVMIGTGAAALKAKELIRGTPPEKQKTSNQLIAGGIMYSGVTGIFGWMLEKTGNIFGGEIGETFTGRYMPESTENSLLQVFGPTAKLIDSGISWVKAGLVSSGVSQAELTNKDFRRMYGAMPFQYHPAIYQLASGRWPGIGKGDERKNPARMRYSLKDIDPIVTQSLKEDLLAFS